MPIRRPKFSATRAPAHPKGSRVTGVDRERMAAQLAQAYAAGTSIRELAELHHRSYGFVHRVLVEAGVTLRPRGGDQRGRLA